MHVCGDIEKTPGPLKDFSQTFAIGHWNLNSSAAHNFTKVALLKAYLSAQRQSKSSAYQKHTSTLVLQRMMTVYKYLYMI